ncbi:MAG: alpha/beta fold hydrolase [Methylovulum sp.]|nr:alpha/beta fold hydrolase [Methylovulum sp.]
MSALSLAFQEFGEADKPPLIILHGFFASSRNWRVIAETLAEDYHVLVPDLRNHGASPHHPQLDYPTMVADLLAFITAHTTSPPHVLGHSMGGKVAMWLALNYPEHLDKLLVIDIAPCAYEHSFDQLITSLQALPLQQLTQRKQAEHWLSEHIPELSYRQFLLQNLLLTEQTYVWRIDLTVFKNMAHHIVAFPNTDQVLSFTRPTLFLCGENSNYCQLNQCLKLFPKAQQINIKNAGHWLHVQQPAAFLQEVNAFLRHPLN